MCRSLNGPQESCFCTSRRFNGLPATVSKFGNCILFVGKSAERKTNENEFEKLWSRVSSPLSSCALNGADFMNEIVKLCVKNVLEIKARKWLWCFLLALACSPVVEEKWRKNIQNSFATVCCSLLIQVAAKAIYFGRSVLFSAKWPEKQYQNNW